MIFHAYAYRKADGYLLGSILVDARTEEDGANAIKDLFEQEASEGEPIFGTKEVSLSIAPLEFLREVNDCRIVVL